MREQRTEKKHIHASRTQCEIANLRVGILSVKNPAEQIRPLASASPIQVTFTVLPQSREKVLPESMTLPTDTSTTVIIMSRSM